MIARNRELALACLAAGGALCAVAVLAVAWGQAGAVPWMLLAGGVIFAVFAALTLWRYRRLMDLAGRVDAALHGERAPLPSSMCEGELSILASEIDKLCTRLTRTAEDLAHEKGALADALADISHQLRTPLTSLELIVALLRRGDLTSAERTEKLRSASRLLSRIEWLVESLLTLARLDAGAVKLARDPVDVHALAEASAGPLAVAFDIRGVQLEIDVEKDLEFPGDFAWTAEALGNILKNCLEHTPDGGRVALRAWEDALACRIVVEDTGPGIDPDDLPHIFERFYRGKADRIDPSAPGIGIGLALAQELVRAQGGSVRARNRPEGGARFEISFFKMTV